MGLHLGRERQLHLVLDKGDQLLAAADHLEHALRKGACQVALGDGAALGIAGEGQHVLVKVDGHAVLAHQAVDALDHLAVARVALLAEGGEAVVEFHGAVVRHAVHGHVDHAVLIGVVDAAIGKGRVLEAGAALHADGAAMPTMAAACKNSCAPAMESWSISPQVPSPAMRAKYTAAVGE